MALVVQTVGTEHWIQLIVDVALVAIGNRAVPKLTGISRSVECARLATSVWDVLVVAVVVVMVLEVLLGVVGVRVYDS